MQQHTVTVNVIVGNIVTPLDAVALNAGLSAEVYCVFECSMGVY